MIDDPTRARLDRLLDPWRRSDAPGLILAVGSGGRMAYAAAAGLASLEHGVALRPDHRMAIGSISKHFTAAAVLALQDRGLLSLQDPIGRHVPELSEPQRAPTLDQLLRMSSGLRCYLDVSVAGGLSTLPAGTVLATQCRQTAVNFPPGAATVYCNGGYHLASVALMRATGRGFDELMREHVFDPFGLAHTVAPYDVWITPIGEAALAFADNLDRELTSSGLAVVVDDRDLSPGVRFADAAAFRSRRTSSATAACSRPPPTWCAGRPRCGAVRAPRGPSIWAP